MEESSSEKQMGKRPIDRESRAPLKAHIIYLFNYYVFHFIGNKI